jgi:adenine phosphoribosyltransferase
MVPPSFESRINFQAPGGRCDVTPVFRDPAAFDDLVERMTQRVRPLQVDAVAGIDALGFILGTALARALGKGLVVLRKEGKLPVGRDQVGFIDYSGKPKALELSHGAVCEGQRLLLVDDWIETGAQVKAAAKLIKGQGGRLAGVLAIKADKSAEELHLGPLPLISMLAPT